MSTLSSKLTRLETELNSIRTVSGLEGKVLEEIPVGIETKLTNLNTTISERDAQITELNTTVETKDAQISSLNTTVSEKDTEIAEKDQTIQEQAATITEKEAAVTELNATITTKDAQIESLNTTVNAKNAELNDLAAEIARVNELLTTEQTNNQTLSTEIENLNHIINNSDVYEYITSVDELDNYEHKDWKLYTVLEMTDCTPEMDSWVVQFPATFAPLEHVTETFDCAVHDGYTVHVSPSEITINGPFFEAYGVTPIKYVSDGWLEYTRTEGPGVLHGADTGSKFTIQHPEAFNPILSSLIKCSTNKVKELYVSLNGEYHKVEIANITNELPEGPTAVQHYNVADINLMNQLENVNEGDTCTVAELWEEPSKITTTSGESLGTFRPRGIISAEIYVDEETAQFNSADGTSSLVFNYKNGSEASLFYDSPVTTSQLAWYYADDEGVLLFNGNVSEHVTTVQDALYPAGDYEAIYGAIEVLRTNVNYTFLDGIWTRDA